MYEVTSLPMTSCRFIMLSSLLCYVTPPPHPVSFLLVTLLTKMESFQRRGHRLICGRSACDCSRFLALSHRFETVELLHAEANFSHHLHQWIPGRLPATNNFRNPFQEATLSFPAPIVSLTHVLTNDFM